MNKCSCILIITLFFLGLPCLIYSQQKWNQVAGYFDVRQLTEGPDGKIYASTGELFLSSQDMGQTWDTVFHPNPSMSDIFSFIFTPDSNHIIAAVEAGLFRSKDGGKTWQHQDNSIFAPYSLAVHNHSVIIAAGSGGLWISTDNGYHWEKKKEIIGSMTNGILSIPNGKIFVSSLTGEMVVSNDNGNSWLTDTIIPAVGGYVTAMTYSKKTGTILIGSVLITDSQSKATLFRSTDNGTTWTIVDFKPQILNTLYADNDGTLYAGALKVYRSMDDGLTWQPFGEGLNDQFQIKSIIRKNEVLLAGDSFFGIYSTNIIYSDIAPKVNSSIPFEVWPNPMYDEAHFEMNGAIPVYATLKIYNVAGELITTIFSHRLIDASINITWDTSTLENGIYLIEYSTAKTRIIKKLIKI